VTQRIEIRPDHPLYGTATKLNRTRLHLDELDREIDDFIGRDLYNEDWKYNQKRNIHILRFSPVVAPPAHFGPIIGDIVHNLRSSLDYVICQLAILDETGRPCDQNPKTQFPIVDLGST
jgi:hypothetical protein